MMEHKVPVQSLIDHIKTSVDVDEWAKTMAEELLSTRIPLDKEIEGGGSTWWYVCPECHASIDSLDKFCKYCGQMTKVGEKL